MEWGLTLRTGGCLKRAKDKELCVQVMCDDATSVTTRAEGANANVLRRDGNGFIRS